MSNTAKSYSYLSTGNNEHPTPIELFNNIAAKLELEFDYDLAASATNTKCEKFYTKEQNALEQEWDAPVNWCNPPYSKDLQPLFIKKAYDSSKKYGNTFVFLIPLRADTKVWHDYIWGKADVYIFRGRPKFYEGKSPTYASAVVVFAQHSCKGVYTCDKDFTNIEEAYYG